MGWSRRVSSAGRRAAVPGPRRSREQTVAEQGLAWVCSGRARLLLTQTPGQRLALAPWGVGGFVRCCTGAQGSRVGRGDSTPGGWLGAGGRSHQRQRKVAWPGLGAPAPHPERELAAGVSTTGQSPEPGPPTLGGQGPHLQHPAALPACPSSRELSRVLDPSPPPWDGNGSSRDSSTCVMADVTSPPLCRPPRCRNLLERDRRALRMS